MPARFTLEAVLEIFWDRLPEHVRILSVGWDETKRQSNIELECAYHGKQTVEPYYLRKTKYFCKKCGIAVRGYPEHRMRHLLATNQKGPVTELGVMTVEVNGVEGLKVGVTTRSIEQRYLWYLREVHYVVRLHELEAYTLENRIKLAFEHQRDDRILKLGMRSGKRWGGDTEIYFDKAKTGIIQFIDDFVKSLEAGEPDYKTELKNIYVPRPYPVSAGREKGVFTVAIPVVGVDPDTNEIVREHESYQDAEKDGFDNIALIVSEKYHRFLSGGLRWFKKEGFDPTDVPPLPPQGNSVPVLCIERNQHFLSTRDAETKMRQLGYAVNASKISSVLNGRRSHAGGFRWEYSSLSYEEVMNQSGAAFKDASPARAANQERAVTLQLISNAVIELKFGSISDAAKHIGSYTSNILRAYKTGGSVRGYRVKEIS